MEPDTDIIAENITRLRKTLGLSRSSLSTKAGLNITYVRDVEEHLVKSPTHRTLAKIADALGVPVAALYTPKDQFDWAGEISGMMADFTKAERAAVAAYIQVLKQQRG